MERARIHPLLLARLDTCVSSPSHLPQVALGLKPQAAQSDGEVPTAKLRAADSILVPAELRPRI